MAGGMLSPQYPTNLGEAFNSPSPIVADSAMQQFRTAQQGSNQNLDLAKLLYGQTEQRFPLELQQLQLGNMTSAAQLPGFMADSSLKVMDAQKKRDTYDEAVNVLKRELVQKASDADFGILSNMGKTLAQVGAAAESNGGQIPLAYANTLPAEFRNLPPSALKAIGEAMQSVLPERAAKREEITMQGKNQVGLAAEQGRQQRLTNQQEIDAGKYRKTEVDLVRQQALAAGPEKAYPVLAEMADEAAQQAASFPQGSRERAYYMNEANRLAQRAHEAGVLAEKLRAAAAQEGNRGKVDASGLLGIPPVNPDPRPSAGPGQGKPMSEFKSDKEVGEAYRAGKISKSEAGEILRKQFGYK